MKIDQVRINYISLSDENSYYSDKEKYPVKLKGSVRMKLDGSEHEITVKLTPEQATAIVAIIADGIAATVQSAALTLMQQVDPVGYEQLVNRMNNTSVLELTGNDPLEKVYKDETAVAEEADTIEGEAAEAVELSRYEEPTNSATDTDEEYPF